MVQVGDTTEFSRVEVDDDSNRIDAIGKPIEFGRRKSIGSEGEICLFSSTDELLDFADFNGDKNLHELDPTTTTITTSSAANKRPATKLRATNLGAIENGISLDSYQQNDNNHDDSYLRESSRQQNSYNSISNNQSSKTNNNNNNNNNQLKFRHLLLWKSRLWKAAKWRSGGQFVRVLKMGLKRYYLLLLCLILVIVSCLIASFAISRSVGELDTGSDEQQQGSGSSKSSAASSQSMLMSSREEFEPRTIDLIDLIECGKTFAFTKIRIRVKVPKSSPVYRQRPAFLQTNQLNTGTTSSNENKKETEAASSNTESETRAREEESLESPRVTRFVLKSAADEITGELVEGEQQAAAESEQQQAKASGKVSDGAEVAGPSDTLAIDIRPVRLPEEVARSSGVKPPPISELSALLAASEPKERAEQEEEEAAGELMDPSPWAQQLDPLEGAASELSLRPTALNRTLIDCFVVDTDKRYGQKVSIEDEYRLVASTRRVPFARMLATLIECRHLTWRTLAQTQTTPIMSSGIEADQLVGAASEQQPQQMPGGNALWGSLLSGWWRGADGASSGSSQAAEQQEPSAGKAQVTESMEVAGSRQQPQATGQAEVRLTQEQQQKPPAAVLAKPVVKPAAGSDGPTESSTGQDASDEEDSNRRQGSYLGMGISMVSGIVPNTLWCGLGDRAANYSELGAEFKVDSCCRAHDHCPIRLKPFSTDYGLVNWSVSTRSHCDCDQDFNNCLLAVNSTLSKVIRTLYFRFVGLQCIGVDGRQRRQRDGQVIL